MAAIANFLLMNKVKQQESINHSGYLYNMILKLKALIYRYTGVFLAHKESLNHLRKLNEKRIICSEII